MWSPLSNKVTWRIKKWCAVLKRIRDLTIQIPLWQRLRSLTIRLSHFINLTDFDLINYVQLGVPGGIQFSWTNDRITQWPPNQLKAWWGLVVYNKGRLLCGCDAGRPWCTGPDWKGSSLPSPPISFLPLGLLLLVGPYDPILPPHWQICLVQIRLLFYIIYTPSLLPVIYSVKLNVIMICRVLTNCSINEDQFPLHTLEHSWLCSCTRPIKYFNTWKIVFQYL